MNLAALQDFLAIADAGSLAAAARATGTPTSTLSRRLQELETSLGLRLVERTTRSLRLTDDGVLLQSEARRLIAEYGEVERLMRERAAAPSGRLRLSTPLLFGHVHMPELTAEYRRRWPGVTIEIVMTDRRVDLVEEGFDGAVRVGGLADSETIARKVTRSRRWLVAAPQVVASHPHSVRPADLAGWPKIAFQRAGREDAVWLLESGAARDTLAAAPGLIFDTVVAVRDAAIAGAGLAFVPDMLAAPAVASGALARVLPGWHGESVDLHLVYPSRRHLSARLRCFAELLREQFASERDLDGQALRMGE